MTSKASGMGFEADEGGVGTGILSSQAQARLARPPSDSLQPPSADDQAAVAHWRAAVHRVWLEGDPSPQECGHHDTLVAGVPCLRAAGPAYRVAPATIVYCHGGGYCLGSATVAVPITERLARAVTVVSVDYRLAPENPYPAGLDDCYAVFSSVRADGPVVLAGDSAGANLALACTLRARDRGEPGPQALVLLSPHLDHGAGRRAAPSEREDVDEAAAHWLRQAYCGPTIFADPEVSPLRADLGSLPPTLVQVGSDDSALDQAIRFARRARLAGSEVTLDVWAGLWHTWQYHRDLPEAERALSEVVDFMVGVAPPSAAST